MNDSTDVQREDGRLPYEDLAPQDQVDLIAWEHNLTFDEALAVWAQRHGSPPTPRATERPPLVTQDRREWA